MPGPRLHSPADARAWGAVLEDFQDKPYEHKPLAANTEVRWGDGVNQDLVVPALSVAPITTDFAPQLIDIRHKARVWSVNLSMSWLNFAAGVVGDTLTAAFIITFGVGSAKVDRFRLLSIPAGGPLSVTDMTIPDLPAATIVVAVRLMMTPVAAAARTYTARMTALAAPVTR